MMEILKYQKSSGKFEVAENNLTDGTMLHKYIRSFHEIRSNCPPKIHIDVWVTALCIAVMETEMKKQKDLWELAVAKATKYLLKNLQNNKQDLEELNGYVDKYLKRHKLQ